MLRVNERVQSIQRITDKMYIPYCHRNIQYTVTMTIWFFSETESIWSALCEFNSCSNTKLVTMSNAALHTVSSGSLLCRNTVSTVLWSWLTHWLMSIWGQFAHIPSWTMGIPPISGFCIFGHLYPILKAVDFWPPLVLLTQNLAFNGVLLLTLWGIVQLIVAGKTPCIFKSRFWVNSLFFKIWAQPNTLMINLTPWHDIKTKSEKSEKYIFSNITKFQYGNMVESLL